MLRVALGLAIAVAGCKKERVEPHPAPPPAPAASAPSPPSAPKFTAPASAPLKTTWGEAVPASHPHPAGAWVSVIDLDGIYDLAVRGLPATNRAGDIAVASSVTLGEVQDHSTLSVFIADASGEVRERVVIFDADADGKRSRPLDIAELRGRAARANAMLAASEWKPMLELESVGTLTAGAEQRLESADGAATATFKEPKLEIAAAGKTLVVDGSAWSRKACAADPSAVGNVLLSGVWVDVDSGAVVARVGYEGPPGCGNDPIFAIARASAR